MAQLETNISHRIMMDAAKSGARLFKNTRGHFYTMDSVRALIGAALSFDTSRIKIAIKMLRQVSAGLLVPGASDLIGFMPVIITPEMVGRTIAIVTCIEVKTDAGRATSDQISFCDFIAKNGGFAGIARSPTDARKIMQIDVDKPA